MGLIVEDIQENDARRELSLSYGFKYVSTSARVGKHTCCPGALAAEASALSGECKAEIAGIISSRLRDIPRPR